MKLLILELEGTLVEFEEPEGAWHELDLIGFTPPEDPKYRGLTVKETAYEKLVYYKDRGFSIVVFTSRPDIALGNTTLDDVYSLFFTTNGLLDNIIEGFMVCPDHPDGSVKKYAKDSECYKSKSGLLPKFYQEMSKHLNEDVDRDSFDEVVVVSHLEKDFQFAVDNQFKYRKPEEFF